MKIEFYKHSDYGRGFSIGCRWQRRYNYPDNPEYASSILFYIYIWKWTLGIAFNFDKWKMDERYK